MGWLKTILLGEIGNRMDIDRNEESLNLLRKQQAIDARTRHRKDLDIQRLESQLARQNLAIQALTRFLVKEGIVSREKLDEFIEIVDIEDGVVDGKLALDPEKRRLVFDYKFKTDLS
ncbi:MAG: hypothetical protein ACON4R_13700 [Akkermansiaceae bacterium]